MILCASSAVSGAGADWAGAGGTDTGGTGAAAVVLAGAAEVCDGVGLADAVALRLALVLGAELDASGSLPQPARSKPDSARASAAPRAGM